jgi:hypothetical protein
MNKQNERMDVDNDKNGMTQNKLEMSTCEKID